MKKPFLYLIVIIVIVVAVAVVAAFSVVLRAPEYGIVRGKIADELSGDPVRGVRIVVDKRSTVLYQTTSYKLTRIPPGEYTLEASPPTGWAKFAQKIKVKPGENVVNIPLKGTHIPDLKEIICFSESKEKGITIEIRYVNSEGIGMTEFPQLPINVEVTLWERIGEEDSYKKGKKLFEGAVEHFWDSKAYLAKNKAFIPWEKILVDIKEKKWGIMEVRVHLKQGDFKDTIDDVQLFPEKEEYK